MNGMPDLSEAFGLNAPLRQAKSDHIQIYDDVVNVLIYLVGLWRALVPPYSTLRSASPALVSLVGEDGGGSGADWAAGECALLLRGDL